MRRKEIEVKTAIAYMDGVVLLIEPNNKRDLTFKTEL